jgi:glycyl-tRNA synthetase beta chain
MAEMANRLEYLLEIRAEEIPARMLERGVSQLGSRLFEELMGRALVPDAVTTGFTPRRLVVVLEGLPAAEPDREERVMGPPARIAFDDDGKPTKAAEGFAQRLGVDPSELQRIETDKGEYLGLDRTVQGRPTAEVLAEIVPQLVREIPWPKLMRWGHDTGPWVRPVHGVVSVLDGEVVPFELFGIEAGAETVGHPVLSPESFAVDGADSYRRRLLERGIVVDPAERARLLADAMAERAADAGGRVVPDDDLLAKLAAICSIPGVMDGAFREEYLELPREVLIASLKDHQSAFTVEDDGGNLLPRFLTVMDRPDDPQGRVASGNEWVVEARLADARFFHGEDARRTLEERAGDLEQLAFHAKLGSYAAKAERLGELAGWLIERIGEVGGGDDAKTQAERAARLAKVDLTTEMVKEFTSLQGQVGGIYAREQGEPEAVAQALYDQYLPASTDDPLPRGPVGLAVGLADRLDSLTGIFGLGLVPTGSRDPFGLRRAAQGVVRMVVERELPLDLLEAASKSLATYRSQDAGGHELRSDDEVLGDLAPFFEDRIRHLLGLRGQAYDEIAAGLATGWRDLPDLAARGDAIHQARERPELLQVVFAAKRIENILAKAAEEQLELPAEPDRAFYTDDAERKLADEASGVATDVERSAAAGDYTAALDRIADLAPVLDRFFDEVLVMADDAGVKANRLALLSGIDRTVARVGRLTELVVDRDEHRRRHGS